MNIVVALFLLLLVVIVLIFLTAWKIKLSFISEDKDLCLTLICLYPLIKAVIKKESEQFIMSIYIFNKTMIRKVLKPKNSTLNLNLVKEINSSNVNVDTQYGFKDPFFTGVACGAINIATQFINIDTLNQSPDFLSDKDYIYLNATANVKMGSTLLNLMRAQKSAKK